MADDLDDFQMRFQLQKVVAYRELCGTVRRSGRENIFFALIMLALFYFAFPQQWNVLTWIIVVVLIGGELLVGLFKWLFPSAEGFLLDGLVLLVFAGYNLGMSYLRFQKGIEVSPVAIFFGVYMLYGAINRFKSYGQLRKLFANRPTTQHLAWFDDLVYEIKTADPGNDDQVLDLPTGPHWKAKLLGTTVFFVALKDLTIWILGPDDFAIVLDRQEYATDTHKAILNIHKRTYPAFEISNATWENYQKWRHDQKSGE
jgi:hypothetical protein